MGGRWGYAVSSTDGTRLFYSDADSGDARTPVALCDGIGCDGYVWRYLRLDLAPRRTIHGHYRGHGQSQQPRDVRRVTVPDLTDDVVAVLDDAGISRAVLVGHSMGVQVALETWHRHRDRVAGLVLICGASAHPLRTFRGVRTLEDLLPFVERTVMRAPRVINRLTRTLLPTSLSLAIAGHLEINRKLVQSSDFMPYLEGLARMDVRVFVSMLAAVGQHSADAFLPHIDVPTLIVSGLRDGFTPAALSREMAKRIPGAHLMEVEDGTHTAPIERPVEIDAQISEFLRSKVDRN
jgi:pimeloyl-ACP methyl ester carboxylesterase